MLACVAQWKRQQQKHSQHAKSKDGILDHEKGANK
jgi:hypothetical protein